MRRGKPTVSGALEAVARDERGAILATLVRTTRDLDAAEDALQDALAIAARVWPRDGVPRAPGAWILTAARRRAVDDVRRRGRATLSADPAAGRAAPDAPNAADEEAGQLPDERLELLFACCHPSLAFDAQVALTLRTLGGLTTPEIARAFLVGEATMAQRIVRAKSRIRASGVPFAVPPADRLVERVRGVLAVVYLVFTEGHAATSGDRRVRPELCDEAVRLARLLAAVLPTHAEALGLAALVLLNDARRASRTSADGVPIPLEAQDRGRWDRARIAEGQRLLDRALTLGEPGPYQVQAAIAALHDQAAGEADTDWAQVALLYGSLRAMTPGPMTDLAHAVAVALADGADAGLALVDRLGGDSGPLAGHPLLLATRADLLRRAGRATEARAAYDLALAAAPTAPERAFLAWRRADLG